MCRNDHEVARAEKFFTTEDAEGAEGVVTRGWGGGASP